MSTAVEQAVACGPVTKRTQVWSSVVTSFLGEVYSGFFLTCTTNVRKLQAPMAPRVSFGHIITILIISALLEWMWVNGVYRLSCSCCLGGGPSIDLNPHLEGPSMSLCGQTSMQAYVIQSDPPLTVRGSVRPERRESHKMHLKGRG